MAKTTLSVQRAAQIAAAANFTNRIDDKRQIEGCIQYAFIDVVVDPANTSNDVIDLIELPPGAIIYPELSFIQVSDDMSSGSVIINIGDIINVGRYAPGIDCSAVGNKPFYATTVPPAYDLRHELVDTGDAATATTLIKLKFATLAATVEAGALRVVLAFKSL